MLSKTIVQRWYELAAVDKQVRVMTPEESQVAQAFFEELVPLSSPEARRRLSERDGTQNRNLAWSLFGTTVNLDIITDFKQALTLLGWAEFVAQYRKTLENRADLLKAHCEFYRGVLQHYAEDLTKAQQSYAQAEKSYRDANASTEWQGLAIYAQGAVALAVDDMDDHRARELFQNAIEKLKDAPQVVRDEVQALIDRSLRQWELVNELMVSNQPDSWLDTHKLWLDIQLVNILKGRTRSLVRDGTPVADVFNAARLVETVASRLGQSSKFTDYLLEYYMHFKQLDSAEWILHELIKEHPESLELRKRLVTVLSLQGKYAEARLLLEKIIEQNPKDAEAHTLLGMTCHLSNDISNARMHLRRVLELNPEDAFAAQYLQQIEPVKPAARFSFKDGTLTISGDLSQLLQGLVNRPPAIQHLKRAERLFAQARRQEAMDEYRLAIEADPNLAEAYMGWGDVYYCLGQYYLAIAYFEESIAIKPNPFTYRFMGDAYRKLGKEKQAIEAYRQAIELNPNYVGARVSLQKLLAKNLFPPLSIVTPQSEQSGVEDSTVSSSHEFTEIPTAPSARDFAERNVFDFKTISQDESSPKITTDELATKMSESMSVLRDILSAQSLDHQIAIIRQRVQPKQYQALLLMLVTIVYRYQVRDLRLDKALALAKLKYELAKMLPKEWDPKQGIGRSPARHIADALMNLASIHTDIGELSKALDYYRQAEEWYERDEMERSQRGIVAKSKFDHLLGERDVWATLFESMSHLYRQLGDGEKTPEYARRSVAIDQKRPTARSRIATLLRVGRVAAARRDFDSALRICHKGLDLAMAYFASLVVPRDVVAVCHHIGSILSHLQLFRQALRYHQRALELNRQFAHLGRMHNDHLAIGQIFEIRPDLGQALEHYESALRCLSIATKEADLFTWQASDGTVLRVVDPTLAGSATLAVARMYVQHQAHAQSEKLLALAVELTEVVRSNVAQNEYRIGFQANNMEAYESMIKFQVRFAKQEQTNHNSTNGRVTQAWQYAERARSRAFLELLGTSPIRPPIEIPEHLCHQETQLIEHLEALSQSSDGHQQEQQRAIWDEYEETRTKLEKVWQQMITITPMASDYVELRRGKPLEIKKLKALLSR